MPGLLLSSLRWLAFVFVAFVFSLNSSSDAQSAELLTAEDIKKIAPKAKPEFIQAMVEAKDEFEAAGINTRLKMAHFIAQIMTETGGLRRLDENMNYSFKSLMKVFSRKTVSEADARRIARKPKEVANWVYGHRLGNRGRDTDDGWNYRGSGFIQLTGRDNFIRRGKEIGFPLAEKPDLARDAKVGLSAAIAYWKAANVNPAAEANDRIRVRKLVNGPAAHGAEQARTYFNRAWTKVFQDKEADGFESGDILVAEDIDEQLLFDNMLKEGGFIDENFLATESGAEDARENAIREYQETWDLPVTGKLDEATQEALLDPRMWRLKSLEDTKTAVLDDTPQAAPVDGDPEGSAEFSFGGSAGVETANTGGLESGGLESGGAVLIEAFAGTGEVAANVNMKMEDLQRLSEASAIYAGYEMGDMVATPESFVPFSVIGADDRVAVLDTTQYPARAMVQITFKNLSGRTSICSGTMVSPDTVLTAAHCIHSGTRSGRPFSDFRFIPGRNVGAAPFGECNAVNAFVLNGWRQTDSLMDGRNYDLGAFKLDCRIGDVTGQLAVRVLSDDELGAPTVVHGYAADKAPAGRQWISKDEVRVLHELKGFYDNDTFGGTSGSGVYLTDQPDTLVGVHTNGLHGEEPWASHNAFTRITEERLARIQEWISK